MQELLICVKRQYLIAAIECEQSHYARFSDNTESTAYLNDKLCSDVYNLSIVVSSSKMICDWIVFQTSNLYLPKHSEKGVEPHNGKYSKIYSQC
jgi:hypothetical protein